MKKLEEFSKELKDLLLSNDYLLRDIVWEINAYNGALQDLDFLNLDDDNLGMLFYGEYLRLCQAVANGSFSQYDDYFKIDSVYGDITTYTENEMIEELKNNIEEIVEELVYSSNIMQFAENTGNTRLIDLVKKYINN